MSKRFSNRGLTRSAKQQVKKMINSSFEIKSSQDQHANTSLVAASPLQSNFLIDEGATANGRIGHRIHLKNINFQLMAYNDQTANANPSIVRVVCARHKGVYTASWSGLISDTYTQPDRDQFEVIYDQTKFVTIENAAHFRLNKTFNKPRVIEYDSITGGTVMPGRQYAVFVYTNQTTANQCKVSGHLQVKYFDDC